MEEAAGAVAVETKTDPGAINPNSSGPEARQSCEQEQSRGLSPCRAGIKTTRGYSGSIQMTEQERQIVPSPTMDIEHVREWFWQRTRM